MTNNMPRGMKNYRESTEPESHYNYGQTVLFLLLLQTG